MNSTRVMQLAARGVFIAALLTLLVTAALWLAQRSWFDVKRIDVRGSQGELRHVSKTAVRAAVSGKLRGNFFTMKLDDARRAFETVPWVSQASVRRVWPNRLVVTLTEHRALGTWGDGFLLSDRGVLFAANAAEAEVYGPLIDFDGPPDFAEEAVRRYADWSNALKPLSLSIVALSVSERASWKLRTNTNQRFELGRDEPVGQLNARLQTIVNNYPAVVARLGGAPARIDARYPSGFAASPAKKL